MKRRRESGPKPQEGDQRLVQTQPTHTLRAAADDHSQAHALASLRESGLLTDVTIVVEETEFPAHRIVLAASSDYFKKHFSSGMRDRDSERIKLSDVTAAGFEAALTFIYKRECEVTESSLTETMQAAAWLDVPVLLRAVASFVADKLTVEGIWNAWSIIDTFGGRAELASLEDACVALACRSLDELSSAAGFPSVPAERLVAVLGSDKLVGGEEEVWHVAMQWLEAQDPAAGADVVARVVKCVRFEALAPQFLLETVEQSKVAEDPTVKAWLAEAYRFHALPLALRPESAASRAMRWSATDKHEWVKLSEDGMEASLGFGEDEECDPYSMLNGLVRANRGWTDGAHYWEISFPNADTAGDGYTSFGVVAGDVPLGGDVYLAIGGAHGRGWGFLTQGVSAVHNDEEVDLDGDGDARLITRSSRFGLLLDCDAGTLSLFQSGSRLHTFTGLREKVPTGPLYPAVEAGTLMYRKFRADFTAKMPLYVALSARGSA